MNAHAYRMDAIAQMSGMALGRCFGGVQKLYVRTGVDKSTASRHFKGQNAPSNKFLIDIATADKATAYPIISEAIAIVNQAQVQRVPTPRLRARLDEINELEHDLDADEDRQMMRTAADPSPAQMQAAAMADIRLAELCLERAALLREGALRGGL